jgi:tRNA wybutosine-synthesizing protein 2
MAKAHGKVVKDILRSNNWLDTSRNVISERDYIELPVKESVSEPELVNELPQELKDCIELTTQLKPIFKDRQTTPFDEISQICRSNLKLSDGELKLLPNKWELLGDVLVLRLPDKLRDQWLAIAEVYSGVLGTKAVLRRVDKVQGVYREPGVELITGKSTETMHVENKIKFKFDPLKVMYSSGNIDERIRISTLAKHEDSVVDMFAGIGYFSIPIAVHSQPRAMLACELNPIAHEYLCENIMLNRVEDIVKPILGDNRDSIPTGSADRVIMGYLKSEHSHRLAAFKALKPSGGVIHFHDVGFKKDAIGSAFEKLKQSLANSEFSSLFDAEMFNHYIIKSYGPKLIHVVLDVHLQQK